MIKRVEISAAAAKDIKRLPRNIVEKTYTWMEDVIFSGVEWTRKKISLHDKPLQGKRFGQRSVRLNRAYRLIYRISADDLGKFVLVEEVNKHEY